MEINWSRREKIASAIIGGISSAFLAISFFNPIIAFPSKYFLFVGIAINGYALAISPYILFEPVSFEGFKLRGPILAGGAALLAICGATCFVLSFWYWLTGRML